MDWKPIALRTALLASLWWVLSGGRADSWYVGAAAICAALLAWRRLPARPFAPLRAGAILPFLWFFLVASLRGGLQVAARAARPDPGLRPGMLEVSLRLPGETERLFLAATISLLPGTVATGLDGVLLRLHVLDPRLEPLHEVRTAERHVARLFGRELA